MTTEATTLGNVVSRTGGVLQTGPFGSQLHASDYTMFGTPLVMPVNLGDNEIREEGIARVGAADALRLRRHALRQGDIIFSRRGDVGRRSLVLSEQSGWLCGTGCLAARFGSRRAGVNPAYVSLYLGSASAQTWLLDNAVGGTMPNLNTSILSSLPIRLPSRQEQDAIVQAVNDAANIIATLERLIAKMQAIKQAMMQQLLTGRTRLPGFENPWREMPIGQLATITKGQQLGRASLDFQHSVPVWNGGIVPSGYTSSPNVRRAVVTVSEGGNSCGWVGLPKGNFWLGGHCYALDPKPAGHSVEYLYHALKAKEPVIMGLRVGSGLPNIQKKSLAEFVVAVPSDPEEAQAIARVLDDADNEVATLRARLDKSRSIKAGMMQQLMTGLTRLPVPERVFS